MEFPSAWYQVCICGRTFSVPQAYTYHKRSCEQTKKRLAGALDKAKEVWQVKKRQRLEEKTVAERTNAPEPAQNDSGCLTMPFVPEVSFFELASVSQPKYDCQSVIHSSMNVDDLDQALAQRRGRRDPRLPKRYRDMLPDPPAALPPSLQSVCHDDAMLPLFQETHPASASRGPSVIAKITKVLKSPRNTFGLFRQYYATRFPDHDPDDNLTSDDLMDISTCPSSIPANPYHPYPNLSSFLLGDWHWNDGVTKTLSSFRNLLGIVGHPEFRPADVAGTNWQYINAQLGRDQSRARLIGDGNEDGDGWEDEPTNGNWIETPIKINVPFHRRTLRPGQEEFEVGKLRHRKLVSVIREKILRPSSHPHFHLEPYKLYWQPSETSEPVRVHGELFSSDAFIDAHRDLQDSPGEPGCELPRVVVGLMFASDGTHLTAFSNAKLWPVYLAMGNESKDRRSKPSCQAFEHVAYFESVSATLVVCYQEPESFTIPFHSSLMLSRLS